MTDLDTETANTEDYAARGLWYEAMDHAFGETNAVNPDVRALLKQIDLTRLFLDTPAH